MSRKEENISEGTAKPRKGARSALLILLCLFASLALLFGVAYVVTGNSIDPRTNLPYRVWRLGIGRFSPRMIAPFCRDTYRFEFAGRPLTDLEARLGKPMVDGMSYPEKSYRGQTAREHEQSAPGERYYWFDDGEDGFGWCVSVRGAKVTGIWLIKG